MKAPRVVTDSDYAECVLTRKSTTGAHLGLSVAGSEFYAGVKGAWILLAAKSMMIDFGKDVGKCVLGTDSTSAKSIMKRREAGRIRHLHCPMLWLRERVDSVEIRTEKKKSEHNTADTGTQAVSA